MREAFQAAMCYKTYIDNNLTNKQQEIIMAKGQLKGNKEAKKPKAEKPKGAGSAYKQSQVKPGSQTTNTFGKK